MALIKELPFRASVASVTARDELVSAYERISALRAPVRLTGQNASTTYGSKTVKLPDFLLPQILSTILESIRVEERRLKEEHNVYVKPFEPAKKPA